MLQKQSKGTGGKYIKCVVITLLLLIYISYLQGQDASDCGRQLLFMPRGWRQVYVPTH